MTHRLAFYACGAASRKLLAAALAALALAVPLASQAAPDTSAQTRYPVVLVHGLGGWSSILGFDYWYGIPQALRRAGAQVYVAQVSGFNSTEVRGEQLLEQVKTIVALTGAQKVNLIGHSHGGPTIRYVAGVAPELVASVTSVAGVNKGSPMADFVTEKVQKGSTAEAAVVGFFKVVGQVMGWLSGRQGMPEVPRAGLEALTTAETARFNRNFPQGLPQGDCGDGAELADNGVRYYSWTGNQPFTNALDPFDYMLSATALSMKGQASDGLVPVCSSKLGKSLGVYRQNHLDEVNQLAGLRDWLSVDPVVLYRNQVRRLKSMGL